MGTTCTYKPKGQPLAEFFVEKGVLRWGDDLPYTCKVLATATVNMHEFYAAVEKVDKATGEREVWAAVIKVDFGTREKGYRYNFCYKEMDETMGPYYTNCPAKVLDLLTPTENVNANAWRAECRAKLAKRKVKFGEGDVLAYGGNKFKVLEAQPRGYYKVKGVGGNVDGVTYRMKPGQAREATAV